MLMLHHDLLYINTLPILISATDKPTHDQRVTAIRAGAWDLLQFPLDPDDLSLKLQTFVHAKRSIDLALADAAVDPGSGLHSRPALARRARELGALMTRRHGGLACIVLDLDPDPADPQLGRLLVQTARVSDVVGALGPTEFALLAPATDEAGALKLVHRAAAALVLGGREPTPLEAPHRLLGDLSLDSTISPLGIVDSLVHNGGLLTCTPQPADSASAVIGFFGGTIQAGGDTLSVPAGALLDTVTITMTA